MPRSALYGHARVPAACVSYGPAKRSCLIDAAVRIPRPSNLSYINFRSLAASVIILLHRISSAAASSVHVINMWWEDVVDVYGTRCLHAGAGHPRFADYEGFLLSTELDGVHF